MAENPPGLKKNISEIRCNSMLKATEKTCLCFNCIHMYMYAYMICTYAAHGLVPCVQAQHSNKQCTLCV